MSNIFYYIINKSDIACSMWRVLEFHTHDVFLEQEAPYLFHHNSTLFYYFYTQKKKKKKKKNKYNLSGSLDNVIPKRRVPF